MNTHGTNILTTSEKSDATAGTTAGAARAATGAGQECFFLEHAGAQLYCTLHTPGGMPRASVLLAGPFASERHSSYVPWVRWARFLAGQGIEALRFDYRGVGESGGSFEEMTFGRWQEDVRFAAHWLAARAEGRPLVLHGLELGGLLAARVFEEGQGKALLAWSPPASARAMLFEALRQKLFIDYTSQVSGARRVREDYVKELEAGTPVEVGGYVWSPALWHSAGDCVMPAGAGETGGRARKVVQLDRSAEPLVAGPNKWRLLNPPVDARPLPLNPPLESCFRDNLAWINEAIGLS